MDWFGTRCYLALVATAALVLAQQPTGEVRIEVKDPSGAVVKAAGTLLNPDTGLKRTFRTDARGMYGFAGLPYGRYQLQVSRSRFATQSLEIDVQGSQPISRTITLALANTASEVDVIASLEYLRIRGLLLLFGLEVSDNPGCVLRFLDSDVGSRLLAGLGVRGVFPLFGLGVVVSLAGLRLG